MFNKLELLIKHPSPFFCRCLRTQKMTPSTARWLKRRRRSGERSITVPALLGPAMTLLIANAAAAANLLHHQKAEATVEDAKTATKSALQNLLNC
jgi:cell division protein FtsN